MMLLDEGFCDQDAKLMWLGPCANSKHVAGPGADNRGRNHDVGTLTWGLHIYVVLWDVHWTRDMTGRDGPKGHIRA